MTSRFAARTARASALASARRGAWSRSEGGYYHDGRFPTLADVPTRAISMSVRQLLDSNELICIVPETRILGLGTRMVERVLGIPSPATPVERGDTPAIRSRIGEPASRR